jgi:hypothetical protein
MRISAEDFKGKFLLLDGGDEAAGPKRSCGSVHGASLEVAVFSEDIDGQLLKRGSTCS